MDLNPQADGEHIIVRLPKWVTFLLLLFLQGFIKQCCTCAKLTLLPHMLFLLATTEPQTNTGSHCWSRPLNRQKMWRPPSVALGKTQWPTSKSRRMPFPKTTWRNWRTRFVTFGCPRPLVHMLIYLYIYLLHTSFHTGAEDNGRVYKESRVTVQDQRATNQWPMIIIRIYIECPPTYCPCHVSVWTTVNHHEWINESNSYIGVASKFDWHRSFT